MPSMWQPVLVPTIDGDGLILLPAELLETMRRHCQSAVDVPEAGGILSLRGPHIEICACTEPMVGDRRSRVLFDRRDPGHVIAARTAFELSAGTVGYVGEWHTHPQTEPSPSSQDLANWHQLRAIAGHRLAMIIIGTDGLFVTSWG